MPQLTFASQSSFEKCSRKSRRKQFLATMEKVVPWRELESLIEPYYRKAGNGWQPVGLPIMDSKTGVVHSVCTSAASVSDVHMLPDLLHGNEKKVRGDAGYQGQTEAIHAAAPEAQDITSRRVKTRAGIDEAQKRKNRTEARVRSNVEWPLRILKRVLGYTQVRYRGFKKNHESLPASFALFHLYQHRNRLALMGP